MITRSSACFDPARSSLLKTVPSLFFSGWNGGMAAQCCFYNYCVCFSWWLCWRLRENIRWRCRARWKPRLLLDWSHASEFEEAGLAAPLYQGEKMIHQYMALCLLCLCVYKFVPTLFIPYGADGSGILKAKPFWKVACVTGCAMVLVLRLFVGAASSASLDLRWHLMCVAYEAFILGMYGYF